MKGFLKKIPAFAGLGLLLVGPARAQSVVDLWGTVAPPPAPVLQPVQIDPKTTALLVLDFNGTETPGTGPCNAHIVPRCVASIPVEAAMLRAARAHGVLVIYSKTAKATRADIAPALAPEAPDPVVSAGPDKFIGTDLAALLASHGINTVIVSGTAAEGAVLQTATDAILREKLAVILPVDAMSSASLYAEQYVTWQLTHAPGLAGHVVLTSSALISYPP